ncbi:MAG: hypothetical protein R3E62_04375 [Pseudomonadales bacterium]|jgi:hypothetical protein
MSSPYYEIVKLADGEIALQRVDDEGEPLVRISFSDEAKFFLQEQYVDVAKAMINTGIRVVGQLQDGEEIESEDGESVSRTVH